MSKYITVIFSVYYDKSCLQVNQSDFHAYLWTLKYRIDSGHWSKASQGLDVCVLGQQTSALGVTGEGQRAQMLQVQMALPAGWLEKVLTWHHLSKIHQEGKKSR